MATAVEGQHGGLADFNIHHGFTEALVRGMRSSFLPDSDYHHLTQCESLEDVKLNLTESDYGSVVADISSLTPSNLQSAAVQKVTFLAFTMQLFRTIFLFLKNSNLFGYRNQLACFRVSVPSQPSCSTSIYFP